LGLRQRHGLTVLTVVRVGKMMGNPAGTYHLEAGDRLILIGSAAQLAATAVLFRSGDAAEALRPPLGDPPPA
jgi:K+/H+ antiporter YhaU regulatory subunit KhtT